MRGRYGLINALFSKTGWLAAGFTALVLHAAAAQAARPVPQPRHEIYGIDSVIEQIDFRDVALGDALKILSDQSGLNILASKAAASISVTMYLKRVTSLEVIDALAKTYNLWYQRDPESNIVRIYTVKEYRLEEVEFKKEETEIFTLKNAKNALDLAETVKNLFSDRVILSYGRNQTELTTDLQQRFRRFDMIDGRTSLGKGGGGSSGGSQSFNQNFNNSQNQSGQYGQQNRQEQNRKRINLEQDLISRIEGSQSENLLLGDAAQNKEMIEASMRHQAPIFVGVIKHQNRVLVRTRDHDAMAEIRRLYKQLDTESSMLLMEVKVLSVDLSDGYNSLFDFKVKTNNGGVSTLNATQTIGATEALDTGLRTAAAVFDPSLLATVVSNNFEARLQLLEQEGRVTELATPMLLTTNQEVSRVFVGEERPIISGYSASASIGATGTVSGSTVLSTPILVPETDVRAIGTTLLLTPNINADRTVSIQLLVEQSTLAAGKGTIPVQIGNTLQDANIDLVQERTFSGTVVAKDQTAVAVGGLIEEAAANNEKKVPVLGDIPGLGFFFREDAQSRARKELVIIVKPHIMATPADAEPASKAFLRENSVHPNAMEADGMDVYSNPDKRHKGYVLEQPYKEYSQQDAFDKFRGRGDSREFPERDTAPAPAGNGRIPANQQVYVDLTRYASEAVHAPAGERTYDPKISMEPVSQFRQVDLSYDARILAMPIGSWRQGGVYVTALELHNKSSGRITVDYRHLKGKWLASTIENEVLDGRDSRNNVTYLYLISGQPFDEVMAVADR
jgi:general secretion pathway protein D